TTTGPLGQGIATAVGMALAERMLNARFGKGLVDHYTYVVAGDGCLMEGISHEAADLAGHLGLGHLIVLWDDNRISIDGSTCLSTSTEQLTRFRAYGWHVQSVDGHSPTAITDAIRRAKSTSRPSFIACKTIIGYGAPNKQGTEAVHGAPLGKDEIAAARERLGWTFPPFVVPEHVKTAWRSAGQRGCATRRAWESRLAVSPQQQAFLDAMSGRVPDQVFERLRAHKRATAATAATAPKVATRRASEMALEVINGATEQTIGGSADLTHSNLTLTPGMVPVQRGSFNGRYIHYGIREHG
ncbi:MAG: transketolase, partial [Kiloniellaceae bacterium]|nr:transketolase [Kiloniellaceae bacterium]